MKIFDNSVALFLQNMRGKNYSQASVKSYISALKFYERFLKLYSVEEPFTFETVVLFANYLNNLKKNGALSFCSIDNYYSKIRVFGNFLYSEKLVFANYFDAVKIFREKRAGAGRRGIPVKQMKKILQQPDIKKPKGIRDRAILELFYSTGIRIAELCGLQIYDIDLNAGFIKVSGKGGKERIVPVGKSACFFLDEYINKIRINYLKDLTEKKLFVTYYGSPLSITAIGKYVKYYIKSAAIQQKYSCHSFRHTCAVEMLKGGASIKHTQEMLGHSRISTTNIYTQLTPQDLIKIYRKTHPANWIFTELVTHIETAAGLQG